MYEITEVLLMFRTNGFTNRKDIAVETGYVFVSPLFI